MTNMYVLDKLSFQLANLEMTHDLNDKPVQTRQNNFRKKGKIASKAETAI